MAAMIMQIIQIMAPMIFARSGPMTFATMYCGTRNEISAIRIIGMSPFSALTPCPITITAMNGSRNETTS